MSVLLLILKIIGIVLLILLALLVLLIIGILFVPFVYRVFGDKVNKLGHVFHCDIKTIDAAQCNDAECDFFREFCF